MKRIFKNLWPHRGEHFSIRRFLGALLALFTILAVIIGSAALTFLLVKPYNEFYFTGGDYKVKPAKIEPGGEFITIYGTGFCNLGVATRVERFIENEFGSIELDTLKFNAPAEKVCGAAEARIFVPPEVPPGKWRFVQKVSYQPNITFRRVEVVQYSEWFVLEEGEPESEMANGF